MIALNLLPDVKKQFLKAQKLRNTIFTISLIVCASAVGAVIIGFVVVGGMRYQISKNDARLSELQQEFKGIENLSQILTIRNQANALPGLHAQKPVADRLFPLVELSTPSDVSLGEVTVDFEEGTIEITGITDDFQSMNVYVDTLKNTTFTAVSKDVPQDSQTNTEPESKVIFSEIITEQGVSETGVGFTVTMNFDSGIFNSESTVSFSVPDKETTQSVRNSPLFDKPESSEGSN